MFAGTKFNIGGEDFVVPALSLGQLRNGLMDRLKEHDKVLAEATLFDAMLIRAEVILAAIRRNYPDFDEQRLMDYLDLRTVLPMWNAVLGASGFSPGETEATATEANGTSSPSIAA